MWLHTIYFFRPKIEDLTKDSIRMMWLAQDMNQVIVPLIVSVYIQI